MAIRQPEPDSRRERLWRIIFLSDTKAGHVFDVVLLWIICLSTLTVMLDSVDELRVSSTKFVIGQEDRGGGVQERSCRRNGQLRPKTDCLGRRCGWDWLLNY
jgi:hypothetical protein